jgi:hypothetical protein
MPKRIEKLLPYSEDTENSGDATGALSGRTISAFDVEDLSFLFHIISDFVNNKSVYYIFIPYLFIILSGSAAQSGLWSPRSRGFVIVHNAPQSIGLLWTSDQLVAETST